MNTAMYLHPLTAKQLRIVTDEIGYKVVGPQPGKNLACGDVGEFGITISFVGVEMAWTDLLPCLHIGPGAMTEWKEIVQLVLDQKQALIRKNEETATTAT
jgi:phosphopantothenoylcysteine decarboxylase